MVAGTLPEPRWMPKWGSNQPPMKAPTIPKAMSAIRPRPVPCTICPANHPARPFGDLTQFVAAARAAGADVNAWVRAKAVMMGPAAEARLLGRHMREVWRSQACAGDRRDFVRDCIFAGLDHAGTSVGYEVLGRLVAAR
jgi:hypothetical protein